MEAYESSSSEEEDVVVAREEWNEQDDAVYEEHERDVNRTTLAYSQTRFYLRLIKQADEAARLVTAYRNMVRGDARFDLIPMHAAFLALTRLYAHQYPSEVNMLKFRRTGWPQNIPGPVYELFNNPNNGLAVERIAQFVETTFDDALLLGDNSPFQRVIGAYNPSAATGSFLADSHGEEPSPVQVAPSARFAILADYLFPVKEIGFLHELDQGDVSTTYLLLDLLELILARAAALPHLRRRVKKVLDEGRKDIVNNVLASVCVEFEYYSHPADVVDELGHTSRRDGYNLLDLEFVTGSHQETKRLERIIFKLYADTLADAEATLAADKQRRRATREMAKKERTLKGYVDIIHSEDSDNEKEEEKDEKDPKYYKEGAEEEEDEESNSFLEHADDDEVVIYDDDDNDPMSAESSESEVVENKGTLAHDFLHVERAKAPWRNFFNMLQLRGLVMDRLGPKFEFDGRACLRTLAHLWYGHAQLSDADTLASYDKLEARRKAEEDLEFRNSRADFLQHADNVYLSPPHANFRATLWAYAALLGGAWLAPACREESAFHLFRVFALKYRRGAYAIDREPGFLDPAERADDLAIFCGAYTSTEQDTIAPATIDRLEQHPGHLFVEQCWLSLPKSERVAWEALADYLGAHTALFQKTKMWWGNPNTLPYPHWYAGRELSDRIVSAVSDYLIEQGGEDRDDILDLPPPTLLALIPSEAPALMRTVVHSALLVHHVTRFLTDAQESGMDGRLRLLEKQQPFCRFNSASRAALYAPVDALVVLGYGITSAKWTEQLLFMDCPLERDDVGRHLARTGHAHFNEFGVSTLTLAVAHLYAIRTVNHGQAVAPAVVVNLVSSSEEEEEEEEEGDDATDINHLVVKRKRDGDEDGNPTKAPRLKARVVI